MNKRQWCLVTIYLCFFTNLIAQNVGIGTNTPNPRAILELNSSNKGFLLPRIMLGSGNDNTTIPNAPFGLMIINEAEETAEGQGIYMQVSGSATPTWRKLGFEKTGWLTTGNFNSIGAKLGHNDDIPLQFIVNNQHVGRLGGNSNILFGLNSGANLPQIENISAANNIAIGNNAMIQSTIGMNNIAIGDSALAKIGYQTTLSTQGIANIGIGSKALFKNQWGRDNTVIGNETMYATQIGNGNTVIGALAMRSITNSTNNTVIGYSAGLNSLIGTGNVLIGAFAGSNESMLSTKLFIENSGADKDNALIYGDFAADSLLLNGKTIIKNQLGLRSTGANTGLELGYGIIGKETNAGRIGYALFTPNTIDFYGAGTSLSSRAIKFWAEGGSTFTGSVFVNGYVRLGTSIQGAPPIKMRKITGTGPAVNGTKPFSHGLNAAKILQVSVLMEYGLAAGETIPENYTTSAGYQYEWQVRTDDILITNRNGNSANIGNRPVRILVTYEE
jgi:hypothetical protein